MLRDIDINTIKVLFQNKPEVYSHMDRVMQLAHEFGISLELNYEELNTLTMGALLHDIGKLDITDEILLKKEKLTEEEYTIIKEHSLLGYNKIKSLLKSANRLNFEVQYKDVLDIILQHHERIDGMGYPNALLETEISYLSKIVSLCDSFDAMVSKRSYKDTYSIEHAVMQIEKYLGSQFDTDLGIKFINFVRKDRKINKKAQ